MNIIEIKDKEYNIISNWGEVTLPKLKEIMEMYGKKLTGISFLIEMVSVLSDAPIDLIRKSSANSLASISFDWLTVKMPEEVLEDFELDGIKYIKLGFEDITLGEHADLETAATKEGAEFANFHKITAIIYRPEVDGKIQEYDASTVEERAEMFKEKLGVDIINPIASFFLNTKKKS